MESIIFPEVKTSKELINAGLVGQREAEEMPRYWEETVALIFPNKLSAVDYIRNVLLPKIGREKLLSIWHCLTGPSDYDTLKKAMGIIPDNNEKWLLFKKEDFDLIIKTAME